MNDVAVVVVIVIAVEVMMNGPSSLWKTPKTIPTTVNKLVVVVVVVVVAAVAIAVVEVTIYYPFSSVHDEYVR